MARVNLQEQTPPAVPDLTCKPVNRSWRAREAGTFLATGVAGVVGSYVLHSRDLPEEALFLRSVVWYTVGAAVVCLVYSLAVVLVRRFPTARPARLEGQPAVLLRTWPGRWWVNSALDLGLLVLTGFWVHLAWNTSVDRPFSIGLALVPFLFLTARWLTRAAGRYRPEALWVTESEIVHDSERGRARVSRVDVVRVRGWDSADGAGTDVVSVVTSTAARRSFGPRLLTLHRTPSSATRTSVDTTLMGHPAPEIAAWLSPEGASAETSGSDPRAGRGWRLRRRRAS